MSKSLGNSPDPLELITRYGADGVRVGMLLCSPAGNDLLYDDSLPEQGRNFANKIWNAFRLLKGWEVDDSIPVPVWSAAATEWFDTRLSEAINEYNNLFRKFRISEALMVVYKLFWDDFSGWYLEIIKPDYRKPVDAATYGASLDFFDKLVRLIHPFMPFITEEIWQMIENRKADQHLMVSGMPLAGKIDAGKLAGFERAKQLVTSIRATRKEKDIPLKEGIDLLVTTSTDSLLEGLMPVVSRLANINSVVNTESKPEGAVNLIIGTYEYFIPVGDRMDVASEILKLESDLEYNRGFLKSVMAKLANDNFVRNAPSSVVDNERKKKADAELNIESLLKRIAELKG